MQRYLLRYHNKSYDCENNDKKRQKPKFSRKVPEESVGNCYYAIVLIEGKKKHKIWPLNKRSEKRISYNKQNISDKRYQ